MEGSGLRPGSRSLRGRLRAVDALTLAAVALVVLLVSLPRLRDLALRENESDAVWLARRLAELSTEDLTPQAGGRAVRELVESRPLLKRQIDDVEYLGGGRVLRRHGYLFEVLALDSGSKPRRVVRAWPWQAGHTGRVALVWSPETGLLGHENADGRWSGDCPPPSEAAAGQGWRRVRER